MILQHGVSGGDREKFHFQSGMQWLKFSILLPLELKLIFPLTFCSLHLHVDHVSSGGFSSPP